MEDHSSLAEQFVKARERREAVEFLEDRPNHAWFDDNAIIAFADGSCVTKVDPGDGVVIVCLSVEDARRARQQRPRTTGDQIESVAAQVARVTK